MEEGQSFSDIKRVDILKIFGVGNLGVWLWLNKHIDPTLCSCTQTVFALKTLRAHGMNAECLHDVFLLSFLPNSLTARPHG